MNRLIAHAIVKIDGKYLLIKRTRIKRGKLNSYPLYWDIPGGMVEENELPQDAAIRETKEEVNLDVAIRKIVHEDSNYDFNKKTVFTRLVYECYLSNLDYDIKLQEDEHVEYRLVNSLDEMKEEKIVDYLYDIIR